MALNRRELVRRGAALIASLAGKGNSVPAAIAPVIPAASAPVAAAATAMTTATAGLSAEAAAVIAAMQKVIAVLGGSVDGLQKLPEITPIVTPELDGAGYEAILAHARAELLAGREAPSELRRYFEARAGQFSDIDESLRGLRIEVKDRAGNTAQRSMVSELRELERAKIIVDRNFGEYSSVDGVLKDALNAEISSILKRNHIPESLWREYNNVNSDKNDVPKFFTLSYDANTIEKILRKLWTDLGDEMPQEAKARWLGHMALQFGDKDIRFSNGGWNRQSYEANRLPEPLRNVMNAISSAKYQGDLDISGGVPPLERLNELLDRTPEFLHKTAPAAEPVRHAPPPRSHAEMEEQRRRADMMPNPLRRPGNDIY